MLLDLRRDPVVTGELPEPALTIGRPALPSRVVFETDPPVFAVPAAAAPPPATPRLHRVVLRGVPRQRLGDRAGVAVFDPRTGIDFHWAPLLAATAGEDGAVELTVRAPEREVVLALSTAREHAHHGYLASTIVRLPAPPEQAVEFDANVTATTFVLGGGRRRAGPLQLARVGDAEWLPLAAARNGLYVEPGEAETGGTTILLGAGEYELVDPIDPAARQRFSVPAPGPITVEKHLARPRGRRP